MAIPMKKLFSSLLLLIALGAGCAASAPQPTPSPEPAPVTTPPIEEQQSAVPSGWQVYTNTNPAFRVAYPTVTLDPIKDAIDVPQAPDDVFGVNLGTVVASTTAVSVPRTTLHIKVVDATSTRLSGCAYAEQGWENNPAARQETVTINNREFCLRVDADAAAGNRYNTFAYATKVGEKTVVVSFTIHSVACENYPDPATKCVAYDETRDAARFPEILKTFTTTP